MRMLRRLLVVVASGCGPIWLWGCYAGPADPGNESEAERRMVNWSDKVVEGDAVVHPDDAASSPMLSSAQHPDAETVLPTGDIMTDALRFLHTPGLFSSGPLTAPLNPAISLQAGGKVLFTWEDASTNEDSFKVRRQDMTTMGLVDVILAADSTSYVDDAVEAAKRYCYYVQAVNASGVSDFTDARCIKVSVPERPLNPSAVLTTDGRVVVAWGDASTNETGFLVRRKDSATYATVDFPLPPNTTQHIDGTAVLGRTYCYTVRASNALGDSTFTSARCVTIGIPPIPTHPQAILLSGGRVQFIWEDVSSNETGFVLRRHDVASQQIVDIPQPADSVQYTDTGLTIGRTYCYSVQAVNQMGSSSFTEPKCKLVGSPAAPQNPKVALQAGGHVLFTWEDASPNEDSFKLRRQDMSTLALVDTSVPADSMGYLDESVEEGTRYCYNVQSVNAMGVSNFASKCITVSVPAPPANPSASLTGNGSILLAWEDAATNETGFLIRRDEPATQMIKDIVVGADTTQYIDVTAALGRQYCYAVRALNQLGESASASTACVTVGIPSVPANARAILLSGSRVQLSWDDVSNEIKFVVQREDMTTHQTTEIAERPADSLQYTDTGLTIGTTYCYSIRAVNQMGSSPYTPPQCKLVGPPPVPLNPSAVLQSDGAVLYTWEDVSNEDSYKIRRLDTTTGLVNDAYTPADTTRFSDTAVEVGTQYCYYIQSINAMGMSNFTSSSCVIVAVPPAVPDAQAVLTGNNHVLVKWADISTSETGYIIRRVQSGIAGVTDFTVGENSTQYTDTTVGQGNTYCYTVRAFNAVSAGTFGEPACITVGPPSRPLNLTLSMMTGGRVELKWTAADQTETGFRVCRQNVADGSLYEVDRPAGVTVFVDNRVTPERAYCYWVIALNSLGVSRSSLRQCISVTAPAAPENVRVALLTAAAGPAARLTWEDRGTNETDFRIKRQDMTASEYKYFIVSADTEEYIDTDVVQGHIYSYSIQARIPDKVSAFTSAPQIAIAAPAKPTNTSLSLRAGGYVLFEWNDASTNESAFLIRRQDTTTSAIVDAWVPIVGGDASMCGTQQHYSYPDAGVTDGCTYCYSVQAVNPVGDSGFTSPMCTLVGAPAAPTNPQLEQLSGGRLQFSWVDASSNETEFHVLRTDAATRETTLFRSPVNKAVFVDNGANGVSIGHTYCYSVWAVNHVGKSDSTTPVCLCVGAPAKPENPRVERLPGGHLLFSWDDMSCNETSFNVRRNTRETGEKKDILMKPNDTTFSDDAVLCGFTYDYSVQSVNAMGVSDFATAPGWKTEPPEGPSDLNLVLQEGGRVYMKWQDNSAIETGFVIRRHNITRQVTADSVVPADSTEHCDETVEPGEQYRYSVRAVDKVCESTFTEARCMSISVPSMPRVRSASLTAGGSILLRWNDLSTNETGFRIRRQDAVTQAVKEVVRPADAHYYLDDDVQSLRSYSYTIQAYNGMGSSQVTQPALVQCVRPPDMRVDAVQGAYYVGPEGIDDDRPGAGTSERPWKTIQYALKHDLRGKTLILKAGEYSASNPAPLRLTSAHSGTERLPTLIRSELKWQAIIKGAKYVDQNNLGVGMYLSAGNGSPEWITLDGLQICYNEGDAIQSEGNYIIVRNCWIHHNGVADRADSFGRNGVGCYGFANNRIEFSLIEDNGRTPFDHGVYMFGTGHVIRKNIVRRNAGHGIQLYGSFMYGANGCSIEGNVCYSQVVGSGIYVDCGPGGANCGQVVLDPGLPPNRIYHNSCWGNARDGIVLLGELSNAPHEVMNNVSVGNRGYSFAVHEDPARPVPDFNVIFDCNLGGLKPKGVWYTNRPESWGSRNRSTGAWPFIDPEFGLIGSPHNQPLVCEPVICPASGIGCTDYFVPIDLFSRQRGDASAPDVGAVPYERQDDPPLEMWIP